MELSLGKGDSLHIKINLSYEFVKSADTKIYQWPNRSVFRKGCECLRQKKVNIFSYLWTKEVVQNSFNTDHYLARETLKFNW